MMRRAVAFAVTLVLMLGAAAWQDTRIVGRHGGWTTTETVDPIDDSVRFTARTEVGGATLLLVCDEPDTPRLMLVLDGTYIDGDSKDVVYRIDKNPAIKSSWSVTFQGSWSRVAGTVPRNAIQQMRNGSQMVIRTWTATNLPETSTFSLVGFTNATRPVLEACAWIPTEKLARERAELARERAEEHRRADAEKHKQDLQQSVAAYNARAVSEALGHGSKEYKSSGVFKSDARLHDEPDMTRPLPRTIAAGQRVQILRRVDDRENSVSWFFVRVDSVGDYGWILAVYIQEDVAELGPPPTKGANKDSPEEIRIMATLGQPFKATATVSTGGPVPLFAASGGFSQDLLERTLEPDATVHVLRRAAGTGAQRSWYLVELEDGYRAWVSDSFLDLGPQLGGPTPPLMEGEPFESDGMIIEETSLRRVPRLTGASFSQLYPGTPIRIKRKATAADGGVWYLVEMEFMNPGWVSAEHVEISQQ